MDKIGEAIASASSPRVIATLMPDGNLGIEFKNGMMPPAMLYALAGQLNRTANLIQDQQDAAVQAMRASLDPNMGRVKS